MYASEGSKLVYELMCTQQESKVVLPQPKVKTFSNAKMKIKLSLIHIIRRLTLSAISSALDSISFWPDAMVAERDSSLLWCGLNRRLSWLAPDGELRTTADCLVWPRSSADRSLVVAVILQFNLKDVVLLQPEVNYFFDWAHLLFRLPERKLNYETFEVSE